MCMMLSSGNATGTPSVHVTGTREPRWLCTSKPVGRCRRAFLRCATTRPPMPDSADSVRTDMRLGRLLQPHWGGPFGEARSCVRVYAYTGSQRTAFSAVNAWTKPALLPIMTASQLVDCRSQTHAAAGCDAEDLLASPPAQPGAKAAAPALPPQPKAKSHSGFVKGTGYGGDTKADAWAAQNAAHVQAAVSAAAHEDTLKTVLALDALCKACAIKESCLPVRCQQRRLCRTIPMLPRPFSGVRKPLPTLHRPPLVSP